MARLAGVPTRVATGYATGEYNKDEGAFLVRGTDAHAWVEVFFNGYGWVPFNPRPEGDYRGQSLAELFGGGHWRLGVEKVAHVVVLWALVVLVAGWALAALVDPLALLRGLFARGPRDPLGRLATEYRDLYNLLLRRAQLPPSEARTPLEAVLAVAEVLPPRSRVDRRRLQDLNDRFYRLRYAGAPSVKEITELRKELAEVREQVGRRRP